VIATADQAGNLVELYKYSPYGEPSNAANVESWSGSRFRYTGQTALPEARLYYYKARVYDPKYGRFLQTDPIGSKDDLDLYAYTGGDPINATDPDGQIANFIVSAVVGAVVGGGIDYGIQVAENLAAGKNLKTTATVISEVLGHQR
jgi:RHS repeat-associated protein